MYRRTYILDRQIIHIDILINSLYIDRYTNIRTYTPHTHTYAHHQTNLLNGELHHLRREYCFNISWLRTSRTQPTQVRDKISETTQTSHHNFALLVPVIKPCIR